MLGTLLCSAECTDLFLDAIFFKKKPDNDENAGLLSFLTHFLLSVPIMLPTQKQFRTKRELLAQRTVLRLGLPSFDSFSWVVKCIQRDYCS